MTKPPSIALPRKADPEVSVVVNLHREGLLCQATLDSVDAAVARAAAAGIATEVLYVLDRPDAETREAVAMQAGSGRVLECDLGELSASRNLGAAESRGRYVSFIDGDDLWGDEWLVRSHALALELGREDVVIHPQNNLYFERGCEPHLWVHPDMRYDAIDLDTIAVANRWTALSFYPRSLNARFPYRPNALRDGFGYEDWMWHFETIRGGVLHVVAEGTVHFVRVKKTGSLLKDTNTATVIPRFHEAMRA